MVTLPPVDTFYYLATVYTQHPDGLDVAHMDACKAAAQLMAAGVPVFCPIAHSHHVAAHGELDPLDHDLWMEADRPLMDAAGGLIVVKIPGWETSRGIAYERRAFEGRPIIFAEWEVETRTLRFGGEEQICSGES